MSWENAAKLEGTLINLGKILQGELEKKNYAAAKITIRTMRCYTGISKLRLLGIMIHTSPRAAGAAMRIEMKRRAERSIQETLARKGLEDFRSACTTFYKFAALTMRFKKRFSPRFPNTV